MRKWCDKPHSGLEVFRMWRFVPGSNGDPSLTRNSETCNPGYSTATMDKCKPGSMLNGTAVNPWMTASRLWRVVVKQVSDVRVVPYSIGGMPF